MQPPNFNTPQQMGQQPFGQQQMGQQAMRMKEPPQVITTKDLAYLHDALSWELDVIKKFHHFSQETQNQQAKALLDKACQVHQGHYQLLLKHLNPANSAAKLQS